MADHSTILENLLSQFKSKYEIERNHTYGNRIVPAYAHFVERTSKGSQKAKSGYLEFFEHVFFVYDSVLSSKVWEYEIGFIKGAERDYVLPRREHVRSYMTLVLISDRISGDIKDKIKRLHHKKNYKLSFHGYSTVRVAAIELSTNEVFANRQAKGLKPLLEQAFKN